MEIRFRAGLPQHSFGKPLGGAEFRKGLSAYNSSDFQRRCRSGCRLSMRTPPRAGLGFMYSRGLGVATDDHKAAYWLRKAAERTAGGPIDARHPVFLWQVAQGYVRPMPGAIWRRMAAMRTPDCRDADASRFCPTRISRSIQLSGPAPAVFRSATLSARSRGSGSLPRISRRFC